MRILVTGGAGYIGSTLVPMLLDQGNDVRVLDSLMYGGRSMLGFWSHPRFEFVQGDIRDLAVVQESLRDMEAVVHLAAIVGDPACARDPDQARAINQEAALDVVSKSRAAGVQRFIFASTCSNYGRMDDPSQLADETWELHPISLYAETKVAVEESILDLNTVGFTPTILRFATVHGVGARMRFDLTVNEFTLDMITKEHLVVFGQQFWRPYVHVADVARAIAQVLSESADAVRNQVFNVGSTTQNYQKQQLVDLIKPYAPKANVEFVLKNEDPRDYRVSFEKIKNTLGFEITHTVEDGIREVAQMIRDGVLDDADHARYRN